jgi:hypothetical protein
MGIVGGKSLLFSGLPAELVTLGAYCAKYIGTLLLAFGSGLATSYAAYLVEKHKNRSNNGTQKRRKKGDRAA